jgi:SAM-dependent methyltransferase
MTRDWVAWHEAYTDPTSNLSQRLAVVTRSIVEVLDVAAPGPIRVLSLCAGEARDLAGAALSHPRAADVVGCAVELSAGLASIGAENLRGAGVDVEVRRGDAGRPVHWLDVAPVDLLLLAGIFGNLSDDDVLRTVRAVPAVVRPGGTVIWTRHRRAPDLTPRIRSWFDEVGCQCVSFDAASGDGGFGVGVERLVHTDAATAVPEVLFRFLDA